MKKLLFIFVAASLFISGCNKTETTGGPGRLSIRITDDPFNIASVEAAYIKISKIEIRQANVDDSYPFLELPMDPITLNVFELRNGITEELVNLEVPSGDYDLVRIYVDEAKLKIKDIAEEFEMKVPSGEQTGIKLFVDPVIHVEGGISAELILDFDLSRSFVMRGHDARNGFIFKPCIRASNISTAGRIEGIVTDDTDGKAPVENATVTLQKGTDEPMTALTDAAGHYAFIGVPAGTYSMKASKENYVEADAESIAVVAGNKTTQNFILKGLPVYVSSQITKEVPGVIEIAFSKLLVSTSVPDVAAFTVTVNTLSRAVTAVAVEGAKVKLTIASPAIKGDVVKVAYTKPATNPLKTEDNLEVPSFDAKDVTNNVQ
ncbi:MAG: DUF4382 domain-containing protein [Bacteroidales bacterium]|nr:DUF4382 domain-containing protein [Bacteroidales bacterium]